MGFKCKMEENEDKRSDDPSVSAIQEPPQSVENNNSLLQTDRENHSPVQSTEFLQLTGDITLTGCFICVVVMFYGSAGGTFEDRYGGRKHNLEHRESKHTMLSAKYW